MLLKILSPLRLLRQEVEGGDEESSVRMAVGLGILAAEINYSHTSSTTTTSSTANAYNVVMNSSVGLKSSKPIFSSHTKQKYSKNSNSTDYNYCFLKSCYLCNKTLSLDKEVYMYRGDKGFCSIECRNRQIYVDEMREIEISTKKTLASIRRCRDSSSSSSWRDTSSREDNRERRRRPQTSSYKKDQAIFI